MKYRKEKYKTLFCDRRNIPDIAILDNSSVKAICNGGFYGNKIDRSDAHSVSDICVWDMFHLHTLLMGH